MAKQLQQVMVPDLGDANDVEVIEIIVKPGDTVACEDPLITLEGDKATMEIPSPYAGVIAEIQIKVGDKVSSGSNVLTMTLADEAVTDDLDASASVQSQEQSADLSEASSVAQQSSAQQTVYIPDLGDAGAVEVIEVAVKVGDQVEQEEALITLEGDKATMDVPSPSAGTVSAIEVAVGDKVSTGDAIVVLMSHDQTAIVTSPVSAPSAEAVASQPQSMPVSTSIETSSQPAIDKRPQADVHAGPAVRRIAREFGVDLSQVKASGQKQRILKTDVQNYVKQQLQQVGNDSRSASGLQVSPQPVVDFTKFGEVTTEPLSKIKKISGSTLHRNWVSIPHVTQFGEADITELEAFRKAQKEKAAKQGIRLTPLVFIMKAVVAALKKFPHFNSSLDASGEQVIVKHYYHVGVAVDTPNGLVVPVIRDVDQKGLSELAQELAAISTKARDKGLSLADMQGGCFSISSLGGIGGTAFTPIINAPEVAILGLSRSQLKPVYQDDQSCVPRLMLPLSLSYDHRVIDGADGARFLVYLTECLQDIRTLLL